jgi:hypothetical protein
MHAQAHRFHRRISKQAQNLSCRNAFTIHSVLPYCTF